MKKANLRPQETLSPWWRRGVLIILLLEFGVLIWITTGTYFRNVGPPVPETVRDKSGSVVFTGDDIRAGQELFLRKALMNNGTVWGHGAYMGPDFSAEYLHQLALETRNHLSATYYNRPWEKLNEAEKAALQKVSYNFLSLNRYDHSSGSLTFTPPEISSFRNQQDFWKDYFSDPKKNRGLSADLLKDPQDLKASDILFRLGGVGHDSSYSGKELFVHQ